LTFFYQLDFYLCRKTRIYTRNFTNVGKCVSIARTEQSQSHRSSFHLVVLVILMMAATSGFGQTFTVYNYAIPEGLPSSEVYDVYQDKQKFIWFATDNGVVKFDGSKMETFQKKDGLSDPVVFNFFEDDRDRLWFRTYSGKLSYYENGKIKPYRFNEKLHEVAATGLINFVYITGDEELWFSIRNFLGKIDSTGNMTIDTLDDKSLYRSVVYKKIKNKDLIIAAHHYSTANSIAINDQNYPISVSDTSFINKVIAKKYCRNKLYISLYNDVFEFDGHTVRRVIAGKFPVISISTDYRDNFWVGYLNGGVELYSSDFKNLWSPEFLKKKSVTRVFQGEGGDLWFSTLESGVYHVPNLSIQNYPLTKISKLKSVTSTKKYVIAGDQSGFIQAYNSKTKNIVWESHFDFNLLSLFGDRDDNLWASSHSEVFRYDSNFAIKNKFASVSTNFSQDEDGNIWGVGGLRIKKFTSNGNLVLEKSVHEINRSLLVKDSVLYLGTRLGLNIHDKNFNQVTTPKEFANFKISGITKINDSILFISTLGNGFLTLNPKRWKIKNYNTENQFIANNIYAVLLKDSLIWIGTEKGLAVTSIKSLLKEKPSFNYLTKKNGLISNTVNFLAAGYKSVWAFSDVGFSIIPDSMNHFADKKPLFYLENIQVNDSIINTSGDLAFSHKHNNIKINYGFISFNNQNIFIRYRVAPGEPWSYTKERSVQLSSIAPGDYLIEFEFSIDNIIWTPAFTPFVLNIRQPWWNRWYTFVIGFILFTCLGYWYFKYQQSIYNQKNLLLEIITGHQQKLIQSEIVTLERERNRIAKELHDGVGTNLTAIKLTVNRLLQNHNEPLATDVEEQFQLTIKEIKEIIYGLTPPSLERYGLFTSLTNYVNKLNKTIPFIIALQTFGKEHLKYEINIIVFRVIQELLSNSIKHSGAKNITIHINSFDDILSIVYEDDGIGFSYDPIRHGLGLDSIESRIQSINGALKFESGSFGISYTIDIPIK
jgi:signal transduction histidine kinase